jgi:hypothetical protein
MGAGCEAHPGRRYPVASARLICVMTATPELAGDAPSQPMSFFHGRATHAARPSHVSTIFRQPAR